MSAVPSPVRPADCSSTARVYRPRRPERTALYRLVQQHLETWLAHQRERDIDGVPIPRHVERELRGYFECGILARGFARARCGAGFPLRRRQFRAALWLGAERPHPPALLHHRWGALGRCRRRTSIHWARLLARIYELRPLTCPRCHGEMRLIAFLTEPPSVRALLAHLGKPTTPPALAPRARAPPELAADGIDTAAFAFDQSPSWNSLTPPPDPGFSFDQTPA
jgi:hypothetical protein